MPQLGGMRLSISEFLAISVRCKIEKLLMKFVKCSMDSGSHSRIFVCMMPNSRMVGKKLEFLEEKFSFVLCRPFFTNSTLFNFHPFR